jgi:hypothetical protein
MTRPAHLLIAVGVVVATESCAKRVARLVPERERSPVVAELWQEPSTPRDLFDGAGGESLAPRDGSFAFVARDTSGWSPGFDVRDSRGVEWSVKLGAEAQSEVVASRILWGVGFHQPSTYYLHEWMLTGAESGPQGPGEVPAGAGVAGSRR